jgi:hypothetical protein
MSAGSPAKRKMSDNNPTTQESVLTKAKSNSLLPGTSAALKNTKKMYNNYILSSTLNLKIKRDNEDKPKFTLGKQAKDRQEAVLRAFTPDNLLQSKLSIPVNKTGV